MTFCVQISFNLKGADYDAITINPDSDHSLDPISFFNLGALDSFFAWRHQLIMFSGFLTLSYMVLAIVIAARFSWIEEKVKGLDKGYRLHKHLGIAATISVTFHWIFAGSAKWLIDAGLLERPNRGLRPEVEGVN